MSELAPYVMKEVAKSEYFIDPLASGIIIDPNHVPLMESSVDSPLVKLSHYHGRNFEDPSGLVLRQVPITDENGDIYTTFTIKGPDASMPLAQYYDIEANRVRVLGMLDASTFERCQKVSKILRKEGVLTEWPIFHGRPKLFPDGEGDVGLLAFKEMLYENYLSLEKYNLINDPVSVDGISKAGIVGAGLLEMKFGVMYRAMLSNARTSEIGEFEKQGTLGTHVGKAIEALQARKPDYLWIWPSIEKLDAESSADQEIYLREVLPCIMGENLARVHNAEAYHKFLHSGNWTLAGEIVDLDSAQQKSIHPDDVEEITIINRFNEVTDVLAYLFIKYPFREGEAGNTPAELFSKSYFAERFLDEKLPKLEAIILEAHFTNMPESFADLGNPYFAIFDLDQQDIARNQIVEWHNLRESDDPQEIINKWFETFEPSVEQQFADFVIAQGITELPMSISIKNIVGVECLKLLWQSYCSLHNDQVA
jgi:hypothetical protein